MNLADHLRPLLRDHDCVIIPDFGGLVAEYTPAQARPGGRHVLSPPTRLVAFNQALSRNDGLLVDALCQHLGLPAAEAREAVRQAVALLYQELHAQQRTELPGIGVFRQLQGRGLQFDYTGGTDLLPAAYGLPELAVHPVRATDARLAREQQAQLGPRLRSATRQVRWRRLVPGAAIGLLAGVAVATLYLLGQHPDAVPTAWRGHLPRFEVAATRPAPQQAALAQPSFAVSPASSLVLDSTNTAAQTLAQALPAEATDPVQTGPGTPEQTGKKLPLSSAVVQASSGNVAKPMPLAKRQPGQSTAYNEALAAAHQPSAAPMAHVMPAGQLIVRPTTTPSQPAITVAPAAKASKASVAQPAAKPAPVAAKPAPVAAKPALITAAKPAVVAKPATFPAPKPVAVVAPKPAPVAAPTAAPASAAAPTTIKQRTGRFYIVVAAYSSMRRADQERRDLAHAGRPAKVILPPAGSRLYRVSAADFANRPEALAAAARLRQSPSFDKGLSVLGY